MEKKLQQVDLVIDKIMKKVVSVNEKISSLSRAEKVLIIMSYLLVLTCVMVPGIFWTITGVAVVILAIRMFYSKKKTKKEE